MFPAFISGIEANFPNASITFEKFHVMKLVNEALDKVRKLEQATQPELKNSRYVWLKNQEIFTEKQEAKFAKLKDMDLAHRSCISDENSAAENVYKVRNHIRDVL